MINRPFSAYRARRSRGLRAGNYSYRRRAANLTASLNPANFSSNPRRACLRTDGVLFVGDSLAIVAAIDTAIARPQRRGFHQRGCLDAKIARWWGSGGSDCHNDMKVNPVSKNVYLSASRGKGPDAQA